MAGTEAPALKTRQPDSKNVRMSLHSSGCQPLAEHVLVNVIEEILIHLLKYK